MLLRLAGVTAALGTDNLFATGPGTILSKVSPLMQAARQRSWTQTGLFALRSPIGNTKVVKGPWFSYWQGSSWSAWSACCS